MTTDPWTRLEEILDQDVQSAVARALNATAHGRADADTAWTAAAELLTEAAGHARALADNSPRPEGDRPC